MGGVRRAQVRIEGPILRGGLVAAGQAAACLSRDDEAAWKPN
jgi:hypothetical protein